MPSLIKMPPSEMPPSNNLKRISILALLVAFGSTMWMLEELVPMPIPFFRFGFANIATVLALYLFGFRDGIIVSILRVVLGALILGRLMSPSFVFAIGGAFASLIAMILIIRFGRLFTVFGVSIAGAYIHNLAQLSIAAGFYGSDTIFAIFPYLGILGIFSGAIVAYISVRIYPIVERIGKIP